jgi:hypothetical protein
MAGQEFLGATPRAGRGLGIMEHGRFPVVKGVPGVFLYVDLRGLGASYGCFHPRHLVTRDVRVVPAEVELDRGADVRQHVGVAGHLRTVERDHRIEPGPGGEEVGDRTAEAEPEDSEPAADLGQCREAVKRGGSIGYALAGVVSRPQVQRLGNALLVVDRLVSRLEPPEQVRCGDDVTERGEVLGDGANVRPDAEDLLDQENAGALPGLGEPYRQVERPVGRADLLDTCGPVTTFGHGHSSRSCWVSSAETDGSAPPARPHGAARRVCGPPGL